MSKQSGRVGFVAVCTAVALGCASGAPREINLPPQTLTDAPTSTAEEEKALAGSGRPPAAAPSEESAASDDEATAPRTATAPVSETTETGRRGMVVIQEAGPVSEVTPRALVDASAVERQRRAAADAPVATITNRDLGEQAPGGRLVVVGSAEPSGTAAVPTAPGTAGAAAPPVADTAAPPGAASAPLAAAPGAASTCGAGATATAAPGAPSDEDYWRGQALKIRLDWKAAVKAVDELERQVEELRRRFYEEDDPFYRDNQIKPSWDRALDTLADARVRAAEQERRLSRLLEDGRRSGALPGWLREGIEFEPPATAADTPADRRRQDDPWEPKVLREDARDP